MEQALAHTETSAGFPLAVPATLPDPSLRLTAVTIHKPRFGDTTSEVNLVYSVPGEGVPPRTRLSIVQLGPDYTNSRQHWPADTEEVNVGSSRVRIDPGPSGGHFFMVVDGKLQVRSTGIPRDAALDMIEELLAAEARLS